MLGALGRRFLESLGRRLLGRLVGWWLGRLRCGLLGRLRRRTDDRRLRHGRALWAPGRQGRLGGNQLLHTLWPDGERNAHEGARVDRHTRRSRRPVVPHLSPGCDRRWLNRRQGRLERCWLWRPIPAHRWRTKTWGRTGALWRQKGGQGGVDATGPRVGLLWPARLRPALLLLRRLGRRRWHGREGGHHWRVRRHLSAHRHPLRPHLSRHPHPIGRHKRWC